jgi:hypothetical protein
MLKRRGLLMCTAVAVAVAPVGRHAFAQDADVSLFKVVTVKDDIIVGVTREELAKLGTGVPLDVLATELQRRGQLSVWQYGSTRGAQGELVMAPLQRVVILHAGTARIEPYRASLKVVPPAAR